MKTDYQSEKTALLNDFHANRAAILACARSWPAERVAEVFLGEWCMLDLLAHLSGWDEANREAITAVQVGRLPEFYAHKDTDWRGFNAMHVRNHRHPTLAEQIAEVERTFETIGTLDGLEAAAFYRDYGVRYKGWKVIVARLVESELHDECTHLEQMKTWLAVSCRVQRFGSLGRLNAQHSNPHQIMSCGEGAPFNWCGKPHLYRVIHETALIIVILEMVKVRFLALLSYRPPASWGSCPARKTSSRTLRFSAPEDHPQDTSCPEDTQRCDHWEQV